MLCITTSYIYLATVLLVRDNRLQCGTMYYDIAYNQLYCLGIQFLVFSIAFGDVRISEGHRSGRLEFQNDDGNWGTVCRGGFNNDAGDVACRQLGYVGSSDVYSYT